MKTPAFFLILGFSLLGCDGLAPESELNTSETKQTVRGGGSGLFTLGGPHLISLQSVSWEPPNCQAPITCTGGLMLEANVNDGYFLYATAQRVDHLFRRMTVRVELQQRKHGDRVTTISTQKTMVDLAVAADDCGAPYTVETVLYSHDAQGVEQSTVIDVSPVSFCGGGNVMPSYNLASGFVVIDSVVLTAGKLVLTGDFRVGHTRRARLSGLNPVTREMSLDVTLTRFQNPVAKSTQGMVHSSLDAVQEISFDACSGPYTVLTIARNQVIRRDTINFCVP